MKKRGRKKFLRCGNERGFTLIELLFVTLILPILILALYSTLDMAHSVFNTTNVYSQLNHDGMQVLRYIGREIGQGSPTITPSRLSLPADGSGNTIVRFQIPVDWDNDGDVVTAGLAPQTEWGAYDDAGQTQGGRLSAWAEYSVVNGQLIRRVLDVTFNPIPNVPDRVVANDVLTFTANRVQNRLQMTIRFRRTDMKAAFGGSRNLQTSFASSTILRNPSS